MGLSDVELQHKDEPTEKDPMLRKNEEKARQRLECEAPQDAGGLVYAIILLNGIGVLTPWNMFITIAPQFYVDYWFTPNGTETSYAKSFMSTLGIAAQLPNLSVNILNIFLVIGGSLLLRIIGPLIINCFNIAIVISLVIFVTPNIADMSWFYPLTLALVVVLNVSNGFYQNSIFGLTADFPGKYTNALILGNNICGTFITVINLIATLLLPGQIRTVAIVYFGISLVVLIICGISLVILSKNPFYQYYVEQGHLARTAENSTKPSLVQYLQCFRHSGIQLYNVFATFFITLTIFPAMMAGTKLYAPPLGEAPESIIPVDIFVNVGTFLNFNVLATVGSWLAGHVQVPKAPNLWLPVTARFLFIPFFMFCNYKPAHRTLPVLITSEWLFMLGGAAMALTHGYLSSLSMMNAPRVVHPSLSKVAGMSASMSLVLGIFAGVSFTLVIDAII